MAENTPDIRFGSFAEDWKRSKIGDVITEKKRPVVLDDNITYQLITVKRRNEGVVSRGFLKGRQILVKSYYVLKAKDYVISKRQVVHGANGIVPEKLDGAIVSNEYLVAIANDDITTEFLTLISKLPDMYKKFFVSSYGIDIEKLVFDVDDWKKRELSIPTTDEQKKITAFFKDFDELCSAEQQKYDKLVNFKKSMFDKMFPKDGAKVPEIRFDGFSDEWETIEMGEVGETYSGLSGKTKLDFGHGEGAFVTYVNVFTNAIASKYGVEPVEIDKKQNEVQYGDVFFTTSSETPEEVGMSCIWLGNRKNTYLNSFCFGYRPKEKFDSYYLTYVLRSPYVRKKIIFLAQGISRYNISKNKVMEIKIPVPKIKEQTKIGNFFKNLDTQVTLQKEKLQKLTNIKKAFLKKMFL
ncbi:restriction endonuclease subunit S [Desulfosporosinus nitroreducens]|uniref:Restriction endonuclease subunit S n=1 Tax=Desulfosporosinus nitroreducens TaxID=2018668 RepID=A0ABT8QM58_9FIRM|nr:restriction endonuclease subunit S [Desulfosporosinus nitroreducens]MDO0821957.1 restriction endonuclease subunit S [Desulfosporosinus nitroreducens]